MATLDLAIRLKDQASGNFNKVSSSIDTLNTKLDTAREKISAFSDKMAGAGTKASAFLTAPILGLGAAMLKAAADQEQLDVAFTTMLGSAEKAKVLMEQLKTFSAETPFEMPEVVSAGKQLLAYGIAADDVQSKLRMLGDISAGTNSRIEDIAYLFGTARVQGRLFANDLNQFAGRGIPVIEYLAKAMGVAETSVKDLVSEGKVSFEDLDKAFQLMTADGSKFGGMMAAQARTLGGLWSTLKDNLTITLTDIGLKLVDTFDIRQKASDALEFVSQFRTQLLQFIDANPALVKQLAIWAGIAAAIGPALLALSGIAKVVAMLIPGIQLLGTVFGVLTGPIGLVAAALGVMIALDIGGFGTMLKNVGSNILSFVSDIISSDNPIQTFKDKLSGLGPVMANVYNAVKNFLTNLPVVGPSFQKLFSFFEELSLLNFSGIMAKFGFLDLSLKGIATTITTKLQTAFTSLKTSLTNLPIIGPTIDTIIKSFSNLNNLKVSDITAKFNELKTGLTNFKNALIGIPIIGPKIEGIIKAFENIKNLDLATVIKTIREFAVSLASIGIGVSQRIVSTIETLTGIKLDNLPSLTNVVRNFASALASIGVGVGQRISGIIEYINGLDLPGLPELTKTIREFAVSLASIGIGVGQRIATVQETFSGFVTSLQSNTTVMNAIKTTVDNVRTSFINFFDNIQSRFNSAEFKTDNLEALQSIFENLRQTFINLQPLIMLIAAMIGVALTGAVNLLSGAFEGVPDIVAATFSQVLDTINLVSDTFKNVTGIIKGLITGDWSAAWESAKAIVGSVRTYMDETIENIKTSLDGLIKSFRGAITNLLTGFGFDATKFNETLDKVINFFNGFQTKALFELPDLSKFKWPEMPKLIDQSWPKLPEWVWPTIATALFEGWPVIATSLFAGWPSIATSLFEGWPSIATSLFEGWPSIATALFEGWPGIPKPTWKFPEISKPGWVSTLERLWNSAPGWLGGGGSSSGGSSGNQSGGGSGGFGGPAIGASYFGGGETTISERGYETAILPRGTQILNNKQTRVLEQNASPNGNITLNFYGPVDSMNRVNDIVNTVINEINRRNRR